jgi:tRNA threonylcarbamoyladenosine biosynthesis protein TsaE
MKIEFESNQIPNIVKEYLIPQLAKYSIFTFSGPLGAGKTTLIKEILHQAGVKDVITSPTFTYLNSYKNSDEKIFHHFDLYRLKDQDSFSSAGFDEILNKDTEKEKSYFFIEWPEIINPLLQDPVLKTKICKINLNYHLQDLNRRIIELKNTSHLE